MELIFIFFVFLTGAFLRNYFFSSKNNNLLLPDCFLLGSLVTIPLIYFVNSYLIKSLSVTLLLLATFLLIILIFNIKTISVFKLKTKATIIFLFVLISSFLLFQKGFSYDLKNSDFLISSNTYLDFGAHLPFVRSFSMGNNFPFEIPFYSNGGGVYYFMFDLYAGILEYLGLRIDIALNLITALSFASLIFYLYAVPTFLFKNISVGILSVVFFLFPSNLTILNFIKQKGLNPEILKNIWTNQFYINNFPFDQSLIFNFLSLSTFLNQRHLVFALAFVLWGFLYVIEKNKSNLKSTILLGTLIGLLFLWHGMIFIALLIIFFGLLLVFRKKEHIFILITAIIIFLFQIILVGMPTERLVVVNDGFLVAFTPISNFLKFWALNLGIGIVLIPIGLFLSDNNTKKIFLVFSFLFIISNFINFSARFEYDNHKLINLWIIFMNFFSAFAIVNLSIRKNLMKIFAVVLSAIFIVSGMINNMVVKNDVYARVHDLGSSGLMTAAFHRIPPKEIVLTNAEIYDPMSLIGKRTYLGRAHYLFVYGENPSQRILTRNEILKGTDYRSAYNKLAKSHIRFVVLYKHSNQKNLLDYNLDQFKMAKKIYEDKDGIIFEI